MAAERRTRFSEIGVGEKFTRPGLAIVLVKTGERSALVPGCKCGNSWCYDKADKEVTMGAMATAFPVKGS